LNATGAVVVGRRIAEFVDHWGGDHHGVPIFVPSHRPPGPSAANYPFGDVCQRWNRQRDGTWDKILAEVIVRDDAPAED
jgi:hypothetical protein